MQNWIVRFFFRRTILGCLRWKNATEDKVSLPWSGEGAKS
jgi:hypothetical protein